MSCDIFFKGAVKLLFQCAHHINLHDTPSKSCFRGEVIFYVPCMCTASKQFRVGIIKPGVLLKSSQDYQDAGFHMVARQHERKSNAGY
jgi:hypothetical protein